MRVGPWALTGLLLSFATPAAIQAAGITVRSSFGKPLSGVVVGLFDPRHAVDLPTLARTDTEGRAQLTLPHPNLRLKIRAYGYVFWADPPPDGVVVLPFRRQRLSVRIAGPDGTRRAPGSALLYRVSTPGGQPTGIVGWIPPEGDVELELPDRPYKLQVEIAGARYERLARDARPVVIEVALAPLEVTSVTLGGAPVTTLALEAVAVTGPTRIPLRRSEPGHWRGSLPPGRWRLRWHHGAWGIVERGLELPTTGYRVGYRLPVRRRRLVVRFDPPELAEGAGCELRMTGGRIPLAERRPRSWSWFGALPDGEGALRCRWATGLEQRVWEGRLPAARLEVTVTGRRLHVQVLHARTRATIGPALIGVGPPRGPLRFLWWTDFHGVAELPLPKVGARVGVRWFGTVVSAEVPPTAERRLLELDLPMRRLDPPPNTPPEGLLAQLRADGFTTWIVIGPEGTRLPLADGSYTLILYTRDRRRLYEVEAAAPPQVDELVVAWRSGAGGESRRIRLVWPTGVSEPPPVELDVGDGWQRIPVPADGYVGPIVAGARLRIPAGPLGRIYRIGAAERELRPALAILELELPRPGSVKVLASERSLVQRCPRRRCLLLLPPGTYRLFVPGADLPPPVTLEAGERRHLVIEPL